MAEVGTVRSFNARESKQYGFIATEEGTELFFHWDGRAGGSPARYPQVGDRISFTRKRSQLSGKVKAADWHIVSGADPRSGLEYGRVKFFFDERGYGFFIPDAGGDDVHFHISGHRVPGWAADRSASITEERSHVRPTASDIVIFFREETPRGMRATVWAVTESAAAERQVA